MFDLQLVSLLVKLKCNLSYNAVPILILIYCLVD